ncbi:hypothetical protein [Bradyrhizobium sp. CCBAU 45321]|uniref:hypothetical protein n=1 Tax=Bradyrhizobium sp. CCBAU 45321 TaxID=1641878 RepID=UPI0023034E2D|nr:hypothetical protein [Bradyrhizobium sp. CCBAU 45321]
MDFNAVAPANTSPEPDAARKASDATEFDRQLSDAQAPALAQGVAHPLLQGEAYSPYLDAGHPYSPYFDTGHLYPPYEDLAHPHSPDSGWQDNLMPRLRLSPRLSRKTAGSISRRRPSLMRSRNIPASIKI